MAIQQDGYALEYASDELKGDRQVRAECLRHGEFEGGDAQVDMLSCRANFQQTCFNLTL